MSNELDPEYMRTTIVPKSDQLNADDLLTGPITVTVTGVRRGDQEQPVIVDIENHQPYKPGKSMRRVMIAAWGDDPHAWVGQRLTLYCDPEVKFGGVRVGGVRISHMTGIDGDRTFMLTEARGRKREFHVVKLELSPDAESVAAVKDNWKSARTRAGEEATAELWKAFVFASTGRQFDASKASEWTHGDLRRVHEAIEEQYQ